MGVNTAVAVEAALLFIELTAQVAELTKVITNARNEGRELTRAELETFKAKREKAAERLEEALKDAE